MDSSLALPFLLLLLRSASGNSEMLESKIISPKDGDFTNVTLENCTDHEVWDDQVFSVPGEAFMINCSPDDLPFDFQDVPYNVSWYGPRTQGQLGRDTGRTLARGTALWLFNAELEDTGAYVCVVRTASQCFKQTRYVKVNQTSPEFKQFLDKGGNGQLHCPLRDIITNEDIQGYNIQWYKGCELIVGDPEGKFSYLDENWRLKVTAVKPEDKGLYTCTISFVLAGVPSNISATISLHVNEKTIPRPQLVEPANETVKATLGSSFSKACRVSLLGEGNPSVDLEWISSKQDKYFESDDTQRVYTDDQQSLRREDGVRQMERWLKFSTVEEEDFYVNYSCRVYSSRGFAEAHFTLMPADDCTDHRVPTGVISVSCTLVAPAWFDFQDVPYNISWYGPRTQGQLGRDTGRTLARGTALWLSNAELEDTGAYVCVVRTASQCFKQTTYLIVNQPSPDCAHPYTFNHTLNNTVYGQLVISKDNSIQWHKGCEPIEDGEGKFTYMGGRWRLKVAKLKPKNWRFYTCAKSLVLAGVPSNNSATISCHVNEENALLQGLLEPANEIVEVMLGSSFSKACRVSVLGEGNPSVDLKWIFSRRGEYLTNDSTQRVYSESQVLRQEDGVMQLERWLKFSMVEEEDFYANYSCHVNSSIGFAEAHFTLLPADPNLLLPVRLLLTSLWVLVIAAVIIYYHFKIHIVLLIRSTLPCLYKTTDSDGKLYDAYVAYPRLFGGGASGEAEKFALHTLPQVLEGRCGYKLFIFGRDSPLGDAAVDVVEESMQASRRLLLLYSASTFGGEEAGRERYEREAAMYRALQEGSLRVVLVELEEVGPAQLALFPQSLRHLRQRQGAVRLWTGTRTRGRPADEAELSPGAASLSPSPRFWRELRYHMPVRAKRATS